MLHDMHKALSKDRSNEEEESAKPWISDCLKHFEYEMDLHTTKNIEWWHLHHYRRLKTILISIVLEFSIYMH